MIREINSTDWEALCQRLTKELAGASVTLETIEPDGGKSEIAANAALEEIVFEKTDACSDGILIRLNNTREIVHRIIEPIHVNLHSSGGTDFNLLEIKAESGVILLHLHPTIHPQLLGDLKCE